MTLQPPNPECPICQSDQINYDPIYGFYECMFCENRWGSDENDPDYQEAEDYLDMTEQADKGNPANWFSIQEEQTG